MKIIDLRSDTVTQPSAAMRHAMSIAPVGDDVYGEDPTVNALQDYAAELTGKQAALFVPSGTMGNLLALLAHCQRGDEYIVGQQAHCYKYEGGGAAVLGSIQPQPLDNQSDGTLDLAAIRAAIKADDPHFAQTRLLCLENTHNGKVLPLDYQAQVAELCAERGLSLHLDGARVCNAAAAQGVELERIAKHYDSLSICLSKGLGAPLGSVLTGSKDFIKRTLRWRKMCGGGMRQAGIVAAGALLALRDQRQRLLEDHHHAALLAAGLATIDELSVAPVHSNMVFVQCPTQQLQTLKTRLKQQGIMVDGHLGLRLVTHLDINKEDVQRVLTAIGNFFAR